MSLIIQVQHTAVEAAAEANTRELGARRIVLQRHRNVLRGSLAGVYHLTHWCSVIHAAPSTRMFVVYPHPRSLRLVPGIRCV